MGETYDVGSIQPECLPKFDHDVARCLVDQEDAADVAEMAFQERLELSSVPSLEHEPMPCSLRS